MKTLSLLAIEAGFIAVLCATITTRASEPQIQWQKALGGSDWEESCCVRSLSNGDIIVGGTSASQTSASKPSTNWGNGDFFIARLHASGDPLWERTFGGTNLDYMSDLIVLPDGGFLLGGFSSSPASGNKVSTNYGRRDFWVIRIDANGEKLWERDYGTPAMDILRSLGRLPDGDFVLAGQSSESPTDAFMDWWILRITPTGDIVWSKRIGNGGFDLEESPRVLIGSSGQLFIAGYWNSPNSTSPVLLPGMTGENYWLVHLASDGSKIWDKAFGGNGSDYLYSATMTAGGGIMLAGSSASLPSGNKTSPFYGAGMQWGDYWVVHTDAYGDMLWQETYGGNNLELLSAVIQLSDGGFLMGGASASAPSGNKAAQLHGGFGVGDYWLVNIDASGTKKWDESFGGSGSDILDSLTESPDGGLVLVGNSTSPADGNKTVANRGQSDIWIVKLAAPEPAPSLGVQSQSADTIQQQGFRLLLQGMSGRTYRLEHSIDLTNWKAFTTQTLRSASIEIVDTNAFQEARRFYRALLLP